jgi:TolA-binding protein
MLRWRQWLLIALISAAGAGGVLAQGSAERNDFRVATNLFASRIYDAAERSFADFVHKYPPASKLRPAAILYQAEARFKLTNYDGALSLLSTNLTAAGPLTDRYLEQMGEAYFYCSNYPAAADTFHRLAAPGNFPASPLRLEAAVREGESHARAGDWRGVIGLLDDSTGAFQTTVAAAPTNPFVAPGYLLLSEAFFTLTNFDAATANLQKFEGRKLPPDVDWRRWYLRCSIEEAQQRDDEALHDATNLLTIARMPGQGGYLADSVALNAGILERLHRYGEAIDTYKLNLTGGVPDARQHEALMNITRLYVAQGQISGAMDTLKTFLEHHPEAAATDLALLTLGELELTQSLAAAPPTGTNYAVSNVVQQALGHFQDLTTRFPSSPLAGKGWYDAGWCWWLEGQMTNRAALSNCLAAFGQSIERLGAGADKAVAWFKCGDAELALSNYPAAVSNFQRVVAVDTKSPEINDASDTLCERALFQEVLAAVAAGEADVATNALEQLFAQYPRSFDGPGALLCAGQGLIQQHDPASARRLFLEFEKLAPGSVILPKVQLAVAQSYEAETNWPEAINNLDNWVLAHTNDANLPFVEYSRAYDNWQAGRETNALALFAQFVARFPTHELAARAQFWIGTYYFNHGDWRNAEATYKEVSTNSPVSDLNYKALMMAGRCAMARAKPSDAVLYFTNLTSNPKSCPTNIYLQALFAYGDALLTEAHSDQPGETNGPATVASARDIFNLVREQDPSSPMVPLAWGKIGDCRLELATNYAAQYLGASNGYAGPLPTTNIAILARSQYLAASAAYTNVLSCSNASVSARSQAWVGLGIVAERMAELESGTNRQAMLEQAFHDYAWVMFGGVPNPGEKPDMFWVKRAGAQAALLAELKMHDPEKARNLLRGLRQQMTADVLGRDAVDKQIDRLEGRGGG